MIGKKYYRQITKNVRWEVQVISETLTHVYIKVLNPSGSRKPWNVSRWWFNRHYKELE